MKSASIFLQPSDLCCCQSQLPDKIFPLILAPQKCSTVMGTILRLPSPVVPTVVASPSMTISLNTNSKYGAGVLVFFSAAWLLVA